MGLTLQSTGKHVSSLDPETNSVSDIVIALAGNPNVGKSTVFNALTGMNQHTGNWPGKTVASAQGTYQFQNHTYLLVDLPGTYSLLAHSAEEEVARDFLLFGKPDVTVVVCDATCLERNLNLVLQTIEITDKVVVCVNLMDEAEKKGIAVDLYKLQEQLGVPVLGASARSNQGLEEMMRQIEQLTKTKHVNPAKVRYSYEMEQALTILEPVLKQHFSEKINTRWMAVHLLREDSALTEQLNQYLSTDLYGHPQISEAMKQSLHYLQNAGITKEQYQDMIVSCIIKQAETISKEALTSLYQVTKDRDRKLDKLFTSKLTGIPIMLLILSGVFWLTITGSNYPSSALSSLFFWIEGYLTDFFTYIHSPEWIHGILVLGVYRVVTWVISVMLPPMAIFFPLFTLLEDFGYLPRVAFNLDHHFKKACTCGKQALTMCMGFGCNAAGVVGCRIIDSKRERFIAILTNSFVPCNGRFPTLIALITMFFVGTSSGFWDSAISTAILTGIIVFGIFLTFLISRILSKTVLKGEPSSFTLELPPYRTPQIGKVIVRSIFDRTLFVLGRAIVVAAPAGLLIWITANISINNISILNHLANFLDPFAYLLGLDGIILLAFILGFPANEIVVPIIIMAYLSSGSLMEMESLSELKILLVDNGWTWVTAISTMLFCLVHWPCSTTCLTIKKETGSWKWTALSFLLPAAVGMIICFLFTSTVRLLGLI